MFSSTTTQFNLMSGFSASNLGESFFSSIIAGLFTVAIVTVFCWARALMPVKRTTKQGKAKHFFFVIWMSCGWWALAGAGRKVGVPTGRKCRVVVLVNGAMGVKCLCRHLLACGVTNRTPRWLWKTNRSLRFGKLFGGWMIACLCRRC